MMRSSEIEEIRDAGNDVHEGLAVKTGKFSQIDGDGGVNLQCVNSTDFMVGKQTNFNGPVTIINYADGNDPESFLQKRNEKAEEVVIKEKVMTPGMASKMESFARSKAAEEQFKQFQMDETKDDPREYIKRLCTTDFFNIPIFAWSLLLLFLIIAGCIVLGIEFSDLGSLEEPELFPGKTRNHTFFSRNHWGAAEEKSSVAMKLPVPYVIISSTGSQPCNGLIECKKVLLDQQFIQRTKSESDIYPNFLVSSDGSVYEGRGWNKRNAFLGFGNSQSIEISFIGEFSVYAKPTKNQTDAAMAFIEHGLNQKKFDFDFRIVPANATGNFLVQEKPTMGAQLYETIKTWPRFTPDVYAILFPIPPFIG